MLTKTLKIAALATAVIVATAGASMASQYAWVDHDSNVYLTHKTSSPIVNFVSEGDKVKVISSWGTWVKIKIPGDDGWVKASKLDFYPDWNDVGYGYPYGYGGSFCVGGNNASFCLGVNY